MCGWLSVCDIPDICIIIPKLFKSMWHQMCPWSLCFCKASHCIWYRGSVFTDNKIDLTDHKASQTDISLDICTSMILYYTSHGIIQAIVDMWMILLYVSMFILISVKPRGRNWVQSWEEPLCWLSFNFCFINEMTCPSSWMKGVSCEVSCSMPCSCLKSQEDKGIDYGVKKV